MRPPRLFAIALLTTFASVSYALGMNCPPPPQQFAENVGVEGKGVAEGLLKKFIGGSLEGKVSVAAQDLLSKYPNADRTVIALELASMYCQIISNSGAREQQKLKWLNQANIELLKWANARPSENISSILRSEIRELAHFPDGQADTPPPTLFQSLMRNKLPRRLFDLLARHTEDEIVGVGENGQALYEYKKKYYDFQTELISWENNTTTRIGMMVSARFTNAWKIYLEYAIMRFAGLSKNAVIGGGNFLNYGITWDDAERVYTELSNKPGTRREAAELFALQKKLADEATQISAGT